MKTRVPCDGPPEIQDEAKFVTKRKGGSHGLPSDAWNGGVPERLDYEHLSQPTQEEKSSSMPGSAGCAEGKTKQRGSDGVPSGDRGSRGGRPARSRRT